MKIFSFILVLVSLLVVSDACGALWSCGRKKRELNPQTECIFPPCPINLFKRDVAPNVFNSKFMKSAV
ncbi:unnamed protein product, partial [Mesorhabditis belari]|uniref:Uncharacterized protein n=1 Tax=Mesorhabditis belari TaxID=2138241 RepID=A0AAF3ERH5_9BILA